MGFDSAGRYSATHKAWDHYGNMIPDVEVSEGISPSFPFKPAPWLPVQFYDKNLEEWYTVMPGKLVALDPDGRVMPAHYGLTSQSVTYTANDIAAGVTDITTGQACASATSYNLSDIDGSTYGFLGRKGVAFNDSSIKYPIGVAPVPYKQWAGDNSSYDDGTNPSGFYQHNFNTQHCVPVLCDKVIKLPLVPGQVATEAMATNWTSSAITFGTKTIQNNTYIRATGRYSSTGYMPVASTDQVAAIVLDNYPVAKNTTRTPITSTQTGMLATEVTSVTAVNSTGKFFVDYEVGVIFVFSSGGTTLPVSGAQTVTYFHNATAVTSVYSVFACVLASATELKPGDPVGCTYGSNWGRISVSASTIPLEICGQVLGFIKEPRNALDKVRTAYASLRSDSTGAMSNATLATSSVGLGQMDQMPGSANGGYSDNIHYAGAANTLVVINLIGR